MFDVGGGELILIMLAIVVLFGPKKLPELARSFGKGMAQLRKAQTEFQRNLNTLQEDIEQTVQEPIQQVRSELESIDAPYTASQHQQEPEPAVEQLAPPVSVQPAVGAIAQNAPVAAEGSSAELVHDAPPDGTNNDN
jgi:sec-independent protein translocase protein TatA